MTFPAKYSELDTALRDCGSHWGSAQAHGLLCGQLAVHGAETGDRWRSRLLEGVESGSPGAAVCEELLSELYRDTWRQLAERQSDFELLLPGDDADLGLRTRHLADWCEGFLHGLVSDTRSEPVRKRLAEEPLSEMIRDMLEITRADIGDDDRESNEAAYAELVEFIRVSAQLAYEELADVRTKPLPMATQRDAGDTLH